MEPEVQLHVDQVVSQLQQPPAPSENASPVLGSTPCKDEATPGGDAMFQNFASQDDTGYGTSSGYDYSDSYSAPDPTSCGVARIEVAMHDALASISAISKDLQQVKVIYFPVLYVQDKLFKYFNSTFIAV